ncbi:MAG: phenylalanine--tRNA ligase subunit beta, partial [Bacillota bacterium]|nr:phenylalanine--tRNA ligase subunit beta [Bacillota bacterium]
MRVSYQWLLEYVECELSPEELAEVLTGAGLAVEEIERPGGQMRGVVVGRLAAVEDHPRSDHLKVCQVEVGRGERLQVVSGAPNLAVGALVPVILPGGRLPDGRAIETAEFRGVTSQGMLCSGAELGLEKESPGVLILEEGRPGEDVRPLLGLDDAVLVLELTTNRADCWSMVGVAREVSALTGARLRLPPTEVPEEKGPPVEELARVEVWEPELCPRYTGRVLEVRAIAPSPLWLQRRLRAAGLRPINGVVDVTNYVMLELNQPLHAFDYDALAQRTVIVRRARPGEELVTLDGQARKLAETMLVIADPEKAVGLAGVMGGANSAISSATRRVFLEGAWFDATNIRRTAKALGLRSEASGRFERGIDPEGVRTALNRAARLMAEIGAARPVPGVLDLYLRPAAPVTIRLRPDKVNFFLGTHLSRDEVAGYLRRLPGLTVEEQGEEWLVRVPSFRRDLEAEIDLVEEVARLYGYHRIPETIPFGLAPAPGLTAVQAKEEELRRVMVGCGFNEVVTYSLTSPRVFDLLRLPEGHPARRAVSLLQPLSEEQTILRTLLFPSLLEVAGRNASRQQEDQFLFELGRIFLPAGPGELPRERRTLAGILTGRFARRHWTGSEREADFYDARGVVERLCQHLGLACRFVAAQEPYLHPGRAARVLTQRGEELGVVGELHPLIRAALDLPHRLYLFELDAELLLTAPRPEIQYRPLPRFPAVKRDLALVVDEEIPAAEVAAVLKEAGGELLASLEVFDLYRGAPVEEGRKSLAFSLSFQAPDRTLTDAEVDRILTGMVSAAAEKLG